MIPRQRTDQPVSHNGNGANGSKPEGNNLTVSEGNGQAIDGDGLLTITKPSGAVVTQHGRRLDVRPQRSVRFAV